MQETIAIEQYWTEALSLLKDAFSDVVFTAWIEPLTPFDYEENTFILKCSRDFAKSTINQRYLFEITRCIRTVMEQDVDVRVVCGDDFMPNNSQMLKKGSYQTNLKNKYVFESFVRGKSNELAYGAAMAVAESPGMSNYNPLFLYGGVGLGKTHLMHSIGNFIYDQNPDLKVYYVSSETFTNEFVSAIRRRETTRFKEKYRNLDVMLLDDVQFLVGKEETQEELFHTFNALYGASKQIVLTSDQPPKSIKDLEDRLVSRFAMGLNVDITMPDFETRMAILEKKAELEHLVIPTDVIYFIARNIVSNIRDLEGAMNKVTAYSRLTRSPISLELAEKSLKDMIVGYEKPELTVECIQQIVAAYYGISVEEMNSRKRTQNIVFPRHVAMYLSRKLIDVSLPVVGKIFGGRDHATVIHGCDKIDKALENDINVQHVLFDLEHRIKG
ncbi:MAG: chromosomal replication initiator protein DnaA [Clostridiales bacterium]|jgi:chromosomal replication initiator protein|nr:chromosomal replication initiator protein DnaA [Clostridiales bacterium]